MVDCSISQFCTFVAGMIITWVLEIEYLEILLWSTEYYFGMALRERTFLGSILGGRGGECDQREGGEALAWVMQW